MTRESIITAIKYAETELPFQPRLVPWITLVDLGDERLQFRAAEFSYTLHSDFFISIFKSIHPFLNGSSTVEDICSACQKDHLPETIVFLLKTLRAQGLLQEGEGLGSPSLEREDAASVNQQLNFFSQFIPDSQSILHSLSQAKIEVVGSEDLKLLIQNSLREAGIPQAKHQDSGLMGNDGAVFNKENLLQKIQGADLLVACQETPGNAFFEWINQICIEQGVRWLRVAVEGPSAAIGPTVVPLETACYACYESRLESNIPDFQDYRKYKKQVSGQLENKAEGMLALFWSMVTIHAAMEVVRIISGFAPPKTMGRFFQVTCTSLEVAAHDVLRLPRCSVCHPKRPKYETWDRAGIDDE